MSQFWTSIANTAVKNMHYFSKFLRVKFHCPNCSSLSSLKITIFTEVKVHIPNDINLKYLLKWLNILEASPCQTWVIFACSGTVNLRWNDAKRKFVQKSLKADYLGKTHTDSWIWCKTLFTHKVWRHFYFWPEIFVRFLQRQPLKHENNAYNELINIQTQNRKINYIPILNSNGSWKFDVAYFVL